MTLRGIIHMRIDTALKSYLKKGDYISQQTPERTSLSGERRRGTYLEEVLEWSNTPNVGQPNTRKKRSPDAP
jgi:hypothetical protein